MNKFYLALQQSMSGYYVVFLAPNPDVVKAHALEFFGQIRGEVYDETSMLSMRYKIGDYAQCHIINEHNPITLTTPWKWE